MTVLNGKTFWKKHELSVLGRFISGSGFPIKYQGHHGGRYPFFKVSDMNLDGNERVMTVANNWISEDVRKKLKAIVFKKDTIIMAKIGAAIFLNRKRILSQESCLDNNMMGFVLNTDLAASKYIYFVFQKIQFGRYVTTTSLPSLSGIALGEILISLPTIPEQERIVMVLETWDKAIEKLAKKIEIKKEIKKGLLQNLLAGKIRVPGFMNHWNSYQIGALVDSAGLRNKKGKITRVLSVTNKKGFVLPESRFARVIASNDVSNYKIVLKGDFAYNPSRINVGSISRLDHFDAGILSPMYVVFRPNEKIVSDYLNQWIFTNEANSKIRVSVSGSVRESVDFKSFCSIKIRIPEIDEQQAIAKIIAVVNKEVEELEYKLDLIKEQKQYLIDNLITGSIRVPELLPVHA